MLHIFAILGGLAVLAGYFWVKVALWKLFIARFGETPFWILAGVGIALSVYLALSTNKTGKE